MDHQFVIESGKSALLDGNTLPQACYFYVEYDGATSLLVVPPCSCGRVSHHCFSAARQVAVSQQWQPSKISEIAYVGVEQQNGKDMLIIAFEKPGSAPTFVVQAIEARCINGRVVLLDSGNVRAERHELLYLFAAGALSAPLSDTDLALLKAMAEKEI